MGCNYYAVGRKPSTVNNPIHIGKSSMGWLFQFQFQNDVWRDIPVVWNTYDEVKEWLNRYANGENSPYVILDEYDREISYKEFIDFVDAKQKDEHNLSNPYNFTYSKNVNGYRFSEGNFS